MTSRQKIDRAKSRAEDAALELIQFVEGWDKTMTSRSARDARGSLFRYARAYGAAIDRLTRVRK